MQEKYKKKTKTKAKQSRHWAVTFWEDPIAVEDKKIRYAIYGKEVCPKTEKVHWQSYVEFEAPVSMVAVKKIYEQKTAHVEPRRADREAARKYCMKDKDFKEVGKWIKGQGHRTDLDDIVDKLKDGARLEDIVMDHTKTYCKYRNGIKDVAGYCAKKQAKTFRKVEVLVYHGKAGTGKTRKAVEENEDHYILDSPEGSTLWWDGYEGQKTLIIDEFYGWVAYQKLLRILDGYQQRLAVKGGFTYALWDKVIITSNDAPTNWYGEIKEALGRRITSVIDFSVEKENEVVPCNTVMGLC